MNRLSRLLIASTLTSTAMLAFTSGLAHAAPQVITMTPTSLDQIIKPGATYTNSFQILNQGKGGYTFHVYAAPYHVKGEDYTPDFTPVPNAPKVASWFTFSTTSVHINPGQSATIHYAINVPPGTPAGGYYATAFAETRLPSKANAVVLNERVGEIFYLQVAGPVTRKGQLLTWQSSLLQKPPLTAEMRLENSGSVHYPAVIQVNVQDVLGHSKYRLITVKEVLPQTIRRITVPWNKTPALGVFKVSGSVNFLHQSQPLPTKWVLVMSQTARLVLGGIVVTIAVLMAVLVIFKRRQKRRQTKKLNNNG